MFIKIHGKIHYLWRAVDQEGTVLDILVTSHRDATAVTRFFRKLLTGLPLVPQVLVTDKLASYGVAPAAGVATAGANEAGGPAQPLQLVQAVHIGPEPRLRLTHGPRVMRAGHEDDPPPQPTPLKWVPKVGKCPRPQLTDRIRKQSWSHPESETRRKRKLRAGNLPREHLAAPG